MVRKFITAFALLALFGSCKPTMMSFTTDTITTEYVKDLLSKARIPFNREESMEVKVFVARLNERLIDRDGIAEETIINTQSKKKGVGIAVEGNYHELYIITTSNAIEKSIFLPAIFNADSICIGLGPALIGTWGAAGDLKYTKKLHCKPKRDEEVNEPIWKYIVKQNEYCRSKSIFHPKDPSTTKIEVKFQTNMKQKITSLTEFNVVTIYNMSPNRFGGNKALVYDIAEVFEDDQALHFKFLKSF
jgi:hypothetical protein